MSFNGMMIVIVAVNQFDAFDPIQGIFADVVSTDMEDSLGQFGNIAV